jgi:hypothetical protein
MTALKSSFHGWYAPKLRYNHCFEKVNSVEGLQSPVLLAATITFAICHLVTLFFTIFILIIVNFLAVKKNGQNLY